MLTSHPKATPLPLSTPGRNLLRLTLVRGIAWTGFLIGVVFGIEALNFQLDVFAVFSVILLMAATNLLTWWRLSWQIPVGETEYLIHFLIDILALSWLFYFTGGAHNPFVSYFLVPLSIAAATLSWRQTLSISFSVFIAYPLLIVFNQPLPQLVVTGVTEVNAHLLGMWANFMLSTLLITFFVFRMAQSLRQRDADLSDTREQSLRNEQIMAVATQAAGTAHELGTPLATMAVMLNDLSQDYAANPELSADLKLLRQQVTTCKKTLQALVSNSDTQKLLNPSCQSVESFLNQVLERWQVLRPDVCYQVIWPEAAEIPVNLGVICADITLQQALINLLNNAADASQEKIHIKVSFTSHQAKLAIHDQGPGIPLHIANKLGQTFLSTKSEGLGLGLFLTHATINRLGGRVELYNHQQGGTLTKVYLPLTPANLTEN